MTKKKSSLILSTLMIFIFTALVVQSSIVDSRQQAAPTGTVNKTLSTISGRVLDVDGKPAFQAEVNRCRAYLEPLSHQARQLEYKPIRRAVKGPFGVADVLYRRGFEWHVQTLHRQGYVLVTEPVNDGRPWANQDITGA